MSGTDEPPKTLPPGVRPPERAEFDGFGLRRPTPADAEALHEAIKATFAELPEGLISEHALVGPAGACHERLSAYREAGLQLPVLFPDPQSVEPAIKELAGH